MMMMRGISKKFARATGAAKRKFGGSSNPDADAIRATANKLRSNRGMKKDEVAWDVGIHHGPSSKPTERVAQFFLGDAHVERRSGAAELLKVNGPVPVSIRGVKGTLESLSMGCLVANCQVELHRNLGAHALLRKSLAHAAVRAVVLAHAGTADPRWFRPLKKSVLWVPLREK